MINFDDVTKENMKSHNLDWLQITGHPYRVLIVGGSESGIKSFLFNPINNQPDIDKFYLYVKDPYGGKYQLLVSKKKIIEVKLLNDSITFIEYSIVMDNVCENIEEYNPNVETKIVKPIVTIYSYLLEVEKYTFRTKMTLIN